MSLTTLDLQAIHEQFKPISDDFWMVIHPDQHYALLVISARHKWKHEQWIPRWERWSGRKYVEVEGELGYW